jgi:hypothetical protein
LQLHDLHKSCHCNFAVAVAAAAAVLRLPRGSARSCGLISALLPRCACLCLRNVLLPKTFKEKGRYVDVFEQIDVSYATADLFPADINNVQNSCKPNNYKGTPIMSYASATVGAFTPG